MRPRHHANKPLYWSFPWRNGTVNESSTSVQLDKRQDEENEGEKRKTVDIKR